MDEMIEEENDDDVVSSDNRSESELMPLLTSSTISSNRPSKDSTMSLQQGSINPRVTFTNENSIISEPKASLISWKTRKPLTPKDIVINQTILILFTSGFMASVIGFVSLEGKSGGYRLFRLFYPTGSMMMMSMFLIRLDKYPKIIRSIKVKIGFFIVIQLPCIIILINVLYLNFLTSTFLIIITILLYAMQLVLSFYYAFTCISKLNY